MLSLGFSLICTASTMSEDFKKSKDYAKSLSKDSLNAVSQFHPETIFKDYNSTPSEKRYYQGVEAEKSDLTTDATEALKHDTGGKTIVEHFRENQFEINEKSSAIKNAKLIEEESYALTHGISNDKVNCDEAPKACEIKTHEEICHASRQLPNQTCTRNRVISVSSEHINQRADFEVWVGKKWTGFITVNLITGAISSGDRATLNNPLKPTKPCEKISALVHVVRNNDQKATWVYIVELPSCENNASITLHVTEKFSRHYPLQIALTVDVKSKGYVKDEYWDNGCEHLETLSLCQKKEVQCTKPNETRVIDGVSLNRDCWQYEATYGCASAKADECQTQREKGCLQLSSHCTKTEHNNCLLYEQTYSCEEKYAHQP